MEHDGESRQFLHDGIQHFESQRRRHETSRSGVYVALFGFELVCAVRRADADGQRVAARTRGKVDYFFGVRIGVVFSRYLVFYAGQHTQLALYGHVELMGVFHHLLRQRYVFLIREVRTVDHHRRESHVHTRLAEFERIAVVQVKHDFRMGTTQFFCIFHSALGHIAKQSLVGIVTCALRHLQNHRRFGFDGSLDDGLKLLHVVEVERGDGVSPLDGAGEHFARVHQAQIFVIYHFVTYLILAILNRVRR